MSVRDGMSLSERWEVEICDTCGRHVRDSDHATGACQNGPTYWVEVVPADELRGAVEALHGLLAVTDHRSLNEQMAGGDRCPCDACNAAHCILGGGSRA